MSWLLLLVPTTRYHAAAFFGAAQKLSVEVVVGSKDANVSRRPSRGRFLTLDFLYPVKAGRQSSSSPRRAPSMPVMKSPRCPCGQDFLCQATRLECPVRASAKGAFPMTDRPSWRKSPADGRWTRRTPLGVPDWKASSAPIRTTARTHEPQRQLVASHVCRDMWSGTLERSVTWLPKGWPWKPEGKEGAA